MTGHGEICIQDAEPSEYPVSAGDAGEDGAWQGTDAAYAGGREAAGPERQEDGLSGRRPAAAQQQAAYHGSER